MQGSRSCFDRQVLWSEQWEGLLVAGERNEKGVCGVDVAVEMDGVCVQCLSL